MEVWKSRLDDFLMGRKQLFERNYVKGNNVNKKHTKRKRIKHDSCRYKVNGRWIQGKVDYSNKVIIDLKGNVLREGLRI